MSPTIQSGFILFQGLKRVQSSSPRVLMKSCQSNGLIWSPFLLMSKMRAVEANVMVFHHANSFMLSLLCEKFWNGWKKRKTGPDGSAAQPALLKIVLHHVVFRGDSLSSSYLLTPSLSQSVRFFQNFYLLTISVTSQLHQYHHQQQYNHQSSHTCLSTILIISLYYLSTISF